MVYFTYIPAGYIVEDAQYNKTYDILNITLCNEDNRIYIFQQEQYKKANTGLISDEEKCTEIYNENLNQDVDIYQSAQDNYCSFSLKVENTLVAVRCNLPLDECKKIVKDIKY